MNAKKNCQINKISYQKLEKNKPYSLLSNAGGVSTGGAEATPTRPLKLPSLSTVFLCSLFNKETELFCKWSQPGIMHLHVEDIAS